MLIQFWSPSTTCVPIRALPGLRGYGRENSSFGRRNTTNSTSYGSGPALGGGGGGNRGRSALTSTGLADPQLSTIISSEII